MDIKISVIVTIYGVEKYIERCARSLFEQTMTSDIEFIFVDDCSKDHSISKLANLINFYPLRKSQIKLISHSENKGLPQARLTGLNNAKGEYIWFVDSDDWVAAEACELFYEAAKKDQLDIVISDYNIWNGDIITKKHIKLRDKEILSDTLLEYNNCSVWNKLIRHSLFDKYKVEFPVANMGEDLAIIGQLLMNDLKIGKIDIPLYNYFINQDSISLINDKGSYLRRYYDMKNNTQILIRHLEDHGCVEDLKNEILYRKYAVIAQLMPILENPDIYSIWKNTYPEVNPKTVLMSNISISTKIFYILVYLRIYKILKKLVDSLRGNNKI